MEKVYLKEIAQLSDASVATVSKVLNHCSGVDRDTRDRVFRVADQLQVPAAEEAACELYLITPEIPTFFWKERIYTELLSADRQFRCKYNVYTGLHSGPVLRYLREAKRLQARVVIAVCTPTAAEKALLAELAGQSLVILLSEYADVCNTFYVGSDAEQDGFRLGRFFSGHYAGTPLILTDFENENCMARVRGFLRGAALDGLSPVPLPPYNKLFPAKVAALLSRLPCAEQYPVYSAAGMLEEIELAAKKAGIYPKLVLLGHDVRRHTPQSRVAAAVNQRVEQQAQAALAMAAEYLKSGCCPEQKRVFIPSDFMAYAAGTQPE